MTKLSIAPAKPSLGVKCTNLPCIVTHKNKLVFSEDQTSKTKRPDNSYAYQLGMMLVRGAAKVANNVADGGRKNRDAIKQLRVELDDSRLQCDKLELDVENARVSR